METAYAHDHRRELRRRGDDTWRETPPEFATYTKGEKRQWFEIYEKLREKEEEVRELKHFLDDVEADAAKKQRTMMYAELLAEKPAREGKRKMPDKQTSTEKPERKGKKARHSTSDDDEDSDAEAYRAWRAWNPSRDRDGE
tara:strand:- start:1642 stop:2064 length:423 start_codon:yes stop_codon:yes gene_type:complete